MENKCFSTSVVILAVLIGGLSLLFGIGFAVKGAIGPVGSSLSTIVKSQSDILRKLDAGVANADMKDVLRRLDALENQVKALKGALAKRPAPAAADDEPEEDLTTVHEIPVDGTPILGKANAPVTITVFNDFQCPFCARFFPAAMEAYKAFPDKVKIMIKHYPLGFHPMAGPAAKAALAAGVQGKFYEMADALFPNAAALSDDKFKELAGKIGINVDQFMKDYKDRDAEWEKKIKADMELGEKIGVRGTPSYYLNGRATMARSPEQWKAEITKILGEKK